MKRILLVLACMGTFAVQAQDAPNQEATATEESLITEKPYNQWFIDFGVGVSKVRGDFAPGYFQPTVDFPQLNLGARYMFNNRFGLRADFGYSKLTEADLSNEFNTTYLRGTLEGVINLGNILNFHNWTRTFNLLAHAGGGYSTMSFDAVGATDKNDAMAHYTVGLTPQIKLSNRISLNGDLSLIGHMAQNVTFDGTSNHPYEGQFGEKMMLNASIGLSIALGSKSVSADFYPYNETAQKRIDELEERLVTVEDGLIDNDMDGVANIFDAEPNSVPGVAVNTKGIAVDVNENQIPDELEGALDARYSTKGGGKPAIKELLQGGYVNVYFGFNSAEPETYSLWAINQLVTYLNANPGAKAELAGYADVRGDQAYNEALSERRAENVYNILVAAGVDASRLSYAGKGEDDSVEESSAEARQLVRKVTIKLVE